MHIFHLTHKQGRHDGVTRQMNWEGLVWEDGGVMGANYIPHVHTAAPISDHSGGWAPGVVPDSGGLGHADA